MLARLLVLLPLALLLADPAAAQFSAPAAPCPYGEAEATLRGALVQAFLYPNGNLFYGGNHRPYEESHIEDGYLVPFNVIADDGKPPNPVEAASFWAGGVVGGEQRASYSEFAGFTYRPGLTGADGTPPSPEECAAADRIWVVSRDDIARYLEGETPEADLAEWPVHLGAPVLDGDGIEGNYDLAAGDQPAIRGDVMAFWAMTDTATDPSTAFGDILGLDVAVEAFAFVSSPFLTDTFYRYTLTNRNAVPIEDAYVSVFLDSYTRKGAHLFMGTDIERQMVSSYYAEEDTRLYTVPPATGIVFLETPTGKAAGEQLGLTSSRYLYKSGGPSGQPQNSQQAYFAQQGLLNTGSPITEYGIGTQDRNAPTVFHFSGDPISLEGWSEANPTGNAPPANQSGAGIRLSLSSTGPFRLDSGASTSLTFALAFAQGEDRFDSLLNLRARADALLSASGTDTLAPRRVGGAPIPPPLAVSRPRPNPFRDATTVEVRGAAPEARLTVAVYDVLGRLVRAPEAVEGGRVEVGRGLAAGVYVVRVEGTGFAEAFPVVKIR